MYKFCFYVPATHVESVKQAVFGVGAGRVGDYDQCCWQTLGQGQFRPLEGSNPFLGKQGWVEQVSEYKVEMVCEDHLIEAAIQALFEAHPYEEPAYHVVQLEEF